MADESDASIERDEAPDDETPTGATIDERQEQDERYRGATPPGYDWPTHGGYLGCLLGVMISCLIAPLGYLVVGFLGAILHPALGGFGVALAVVATVALYLAIFVALSRLGWRMGKRFLREYEQPSRPVWGEDDEEEYPLVVEADPPTGRSATDDANDEPEVRATPQQPEQAS